MGRKRSKSLFISNETVPSSDSFHLKEKSKNHKCFDTSNATTNIKSNNLAKSKWKEYDNVVAKSFRHLDENQKLWVDRSSSNLPARKTFSLGKNDLPSFSDEEHYKYYSKSLQDTSERSSEKCAACGQTHYFVNVNANASNRLLNIQETPVTSLLYRSRSLPQLSFHDSGVGSANDQLHGRPTSRLASDLRQLLTLKQHYYPEGGWGWVIIVVAVTVQILSHGLHGAIGILSLQINNKFGSQLYLQTECLGAMSTGVALIISPITITFCRKKSTRITAVFGGLVTALGCLFTSFATQFHQLFFSYGLFVGIGVGITRDCSTLMVAQYFKRKREYVEIFIVSGSGLGIAIMSTFLKSVNNKLGWRIGLQAVTGVVFCTFILGMFYRSASLYHPQRRAILHLKNQKRKVKDNSKTEEKHFLDFSIFRSKTIRIMLTSTSISAFGINIPLFYLVHEADREGLSDSVVILQIYLGLAWILGCFSFGFLVVYNNVECRIAKQYLTQAAGVMCGLCILALTVVHGNYEAYVMFSWIYGIFCGGYHYSLKVYTYERVRGRNFAKAWSFIQCSQAIPIFIGVPISGYISVTCGEKMGYYFSSICVFIGSLILFLVDLHKRNTSKHKHTTNGKKHLCTTYSCSQRRKLSFIPEPEHEGIMTSAAAAAALAHNTELVPPQDMLGSDKPELTCISEEGIADMDIPDNLLDDIDYIGDCITSCNKVENYLMLSEFENNLIAEIPIITDRRGRRWSETKSKNEAVTKQNDTDKNTLPDAKA